MATIRDITGDDARSVCHGSRVVVEKPQIPRTRYTKDFGTGFFLELARFKHPTHQVCFCTERALKSLSFLKAEEVFDE